MPNTKEVKAFAIWSVGVIWTLLMPARTWIGHGRAGGVMEGTFWVQRLAWSEPCLAPLLARPPDPSCRTPLFTGKLTECRPHAEGQELPRGGAGASGC